MTRWLRRPIVWLPITAVLFGLVLWRARPWDAGSRLGSVDWLPLIAALLLNLAVMLLWAIRSSDLLGAAGRPVGVTPLVPMTALANTINNVTPGSVGELLRLYLLRQRHGVDYSTGAAVVLIERIVAIAYLAGSAALAWVASQAGVALPITLVGFAIIIVLPALSYRVGIRPSAVVAAIPLGFLVGRQRWDRASNTLARIDTTIAGLLTNPVRLVMFAGTTALIIVVYASQLWLVGQAIGVTLEPLAAWGALGLSVTVGAISFLPFGLGATDLVLAGLLASVGLDAAQTLAIVFGYRLTTTLPLALAGSASYAYLSSTLPAGGAKGAVHEASEALGIEGTR